jgi:hypothetical protein
MKKIEIGATAGNVVTNKAAGTGWRHILLYGIVQLVADATVATRKIRVSITDGTNAVYYAAVSAGITAGLTGLLSFGPSETSANFATAVYVDKPFFEGDMQLRVDIEGGVAGDSYTAIIYVLEVRTPEA